MRNTYIYGWTNQIQNNKEHICELWMYLTVGYAYNCMPVILPLIERWMCILCGSGLGNCMYMEQTLM